MAGEQGRRAQVDRPDRRERIDHWTRTTMGFTVVVLAVVGMVILAIVVALVDRDNAQDVFNVTVPVVAAWVGTVLAFYFGRENFETANQEIREMVRELGPDERGRQPATAIMRPIRDMVSLTLASGATPATIPLRDLKAKLVGNVSRLPVLESDRSVLYMIHESRIDQYLAGSGTTPDDTLEQFITAQEAAPEPARFGHGHGFLTVSEAASLTDVKRLIDSRRSVQDVFVTRTGQPDSEALGWVSNIRLARYLHV